MIRLFIAFHVQQSIKEYLSEIITELKSKGSKVKWVEPDNMHLTMKFLGNTEKSLVDSIITQLDKVTSDISPIETDLSRIGGFPNLKKPKVIWVDLDKNRDKIINVAKKIDNSLTAIGFEPDNKQFNPHLTLGRVKRDDNLEELTSYLSSLKLEKKELVFDSISLIKSTLTNDGPIYKPLHTIKFSG